jgi:hypothetical protein
VRVACICFAVLLGLASSRARADVDLWPLLEISEDSTTVLYPFYVHEGKFLMLFPLYYRTNEGRDHHFAWPLLKVSDGRLTRVAPLWFSEDDDAFTLFPLVRRTPEYTFFLVPPIYARRDGTLQALLPLYVRSQSAASDDDLWVMWRLFGWQRSATERSFYAGYLYGDYSGPERSGAYLLPLYFHDRSGEEQTSVYLNYFQHHSPKDRTSGLFPLFSTSTWETGSSLYLAPYYRRRSTEMDWTLLFPFFSSFRESVAGTDHTKRGLTVAWPFYQREEVTSASGELLSRYRRFLLFSDERDEQRVRRLRVLGFVVDEETQ